MQVQKGRYYRLLGGMAAVCHHLLHRDLIGIAKEPRMPTMILFLPFNSTMLEPVTDVHGTQA